MTDGDRQSDDDRGGGLSVPFPYLFLSQINGSQITLSKLPHLCKLRAATGCNNGMQCNSCGMKKENIIGKLDGCMTDISLFL